MSEIEKSAIKPKLRRGQQWVTFQLNLHTEMNDRLLKVAETKGFNRAEAIREAIREYLYHHEKSDGKE